MSGNFAKSKSRVTFTADGTPKIMAPDSPRESIEPEADMSPDEARQFIRDLVAGIYGRMHEMPDDEFEFPNDYNHMPTMEKAKQHYGNDTWQLFSGIVAALDEWNESGSNIRDLKERYQGTFVEGVKIGERLAVYEGREFTFSEGEDDDGDSKFTFST